MSFYALASLFFRLYFSQYHRAVAQYWGELARRLADSLVLPLNVSTYAQAVKSYVDDLKVKRLDLLQQHGAGQALG